jgi:hypothetical protein
MSNLDPDAQALVDEINLLLRNCLGASPFPVERQLSRIFRRKLDTRPSTDGIIAGLVYGTLFCIVPLFLFKEVEGHLIWLSFYGCLYCAWAVYSSQNTTVKVLQIIRENIASELSPASIATIRNRLRQRFGGRRLLIASSIVSCIGVILAAIAITVDLFFSSKTSNHINLEGQLAWWGVGWLFLFVTAARGTDVGRFYYVFAEQLADEKDKLYPLDPASSVLVRDISAVGKHILVFWVGISAAILLMIPFLNFASSRDDTLGAMLAETSGANWLVPKTDLLLFTGLVVPVTLSFSLLFGTYVFLKSEAAMRRAVAAVAHDTLAAIEAESRALFALGPGIDERQAKRIRELADLHDSVVKTATFKGLFLQALSLLPLISTLTLTAKALIDIKSRH